MGTKLCCLFYFGNSAVSIVMSFFKNEPNQIPSENMTSQKAKLKAGGLFVEQ